MAKSEVQFEKFRGWQDGGTGGLRAYLGGVKNHPALGDVPEVTTSLVERIAYNVRGEPVRLETLNTIYRRVGEW